MVNQLFQTCLAYVMLVLAGIVYLPAAQAAAGPLNVPVKVARVLDGDTITLTNGHHVRYLGINAPERGEPYAQEATRRNEKLLSGFTVVLEWDGTREDHYHRLLAYVHSRGMLVNEELLKSGAAHLFVLEPIAHYHRFYRVQKQARLARKGIWSFDKWQGPLKITRLRADAEGDDRQNLNGEYVRICNISPSDIDLRGFSINDDHGHRYVFASARLPSGYTALLFTGSGTDVTGGEAQLRFFWHSAEPIWNNLHDTAYLRDPAGITIDRLTHTHEPR